VSYYRITSLGFRTASTKHHAKVVTAFGKLVKSLYSKGKLEAFWQNPL
jgi:hypothetical protein